MILYILYKKLQCLSYKININITVLRLKYTTICNFDLRLLFNNNNSFVYTFFKNTCTWANVYPRYEHCGWSIVKDFGVDCTSVEGWCLQHVDDWLNPIDLVLSERCEDVIY